MARSYASSIHAIWMASRIFSPERLGSSSNSGSAHTHFSRSVKRTADGSTSGCASASAIAISRESVHFSATKPPSLGFLGVVDGVLRDLDRQVRILDDRLAR